MAGRLSARHALTKKEIEFCKVFKAGQGREVNAQKREAYRKAYCHRRGDGAWISFDFDHELLTKEKITQLMAKAESVSGQEMLARAEAILEDYSVQQYIKELSESSVSLAEGALRENVLFGDEKEARSSADKILGREEKASRIEDIAELARVFDDAGFEIVVDLPQEVRADVVCDDCGAVKHVSLPVEAVGKFVSPFKQEAD